MNQLDVLSLLIDQMETVTTAPVSVGQKGEQNVPGVVVREWDANRVTTANTGLVGPTLDASGNITGAEYHFYYEMTVWVQMNADDPVESHGILTAVADDFALIEDAPESFHADLRQFAIVNLSNEEPAFTPPVPVYGQSLRVECLFVRKQTRTLAELSQDVLATITNNIHTN